MKQKPTKVISFRVDEEIAEHIDKVAQLKNEPRQIFVKNLFIPAFQRHIKNTEKESENNFAEPHFLS